jgi:prepilin-type N-terminal cleavage/methylation domain-containing protein
MREMGTGKLSSGLRARNAGFSLIEVMFALVVLAIGLLGGMVVFATAAASNGKSRLNTAGNALVESTMERILAIPESAIGNAAITAITDCKGVVFNVNTSLSSATVPASAPQIDFTQPPADGYSMLYSACSGSGSVPFDVRWRIDPGPTLNTQYVTVSARRTQGPGAALARPITLRTLRGDFQ